MTPQLTSYMKWTNSLGEKKKQTTKVYSGRNSSISPKGLEVVVKTSSFS